jgi:hypothetical protein
MRLIQTNIRIVRAEKISASRSASRSLARASIKTSDAAVANVTTPQPRPRHHAQLRGHRPLPRRAESYRVRAVNQATGKEAANVIVTESQTTLTLMNLAAGTQVDITVAARNPTGESKATDPVTAAVP